VKKYIFKHYDFGKFRINSNDPNLKFIEQWLYCFVKELDIYNEVCDDRELWRRYKERTMVGLLASGLSRNDQQNEIGILQEYLVKDRNYTGGKRSDLYIEKNKTGFVVECKFMQKKVIKNNLDDHFNDKKAINFYQPILKQANHYIKKEIKAYREHGYEKLFTVALLFHSIPKATQAELDDHICAGEKYIPQNNNWFYQIVYSKDPKRWGGAKNNRHRYSLIEISGKVQHYKL
jgi:hypothetical protein